MKKYYSIYSILVLLLVLALGFTSCDKVDIPVDTNATIDTSSNNDTLFRKILVEEFTGLGCGNCPPAAEKLDQLKKLYGDRIIGVAINAGSFATPVAEGGTNPFPDDFRTDAGNLYDAKFIGSAGYPNGMVSRSSVMSGTTDNLVVGFDTWGTAIERLKDEAPMFKIELSLTYDESSREVSTDCAFIPLVDIDGEYSYLVYLVEDHVIGYQTDYRFDPPNDKITDYEHKHVFRGALNSIWGEEVFDGAYVAGDTTHMMIENFEINSDFDISNCSIVAYIYDASTFEVLQAEEAYVLKN